MNPTNDDIEQWQQIANRRNAILPYQFSFRGRKEVIIICGSCQENFVRPLIVAQNDPIYVCPRCQNRNYVPVDWNVIRRKRSNY